MAANDYLVFLSHASKDRWIAQQIARLIEDRGVRTFLDEKDIEGGDSIHEEIRSSIEHCNEMLVLMSPSSMIRPWVLIEIGAAWGLRKRIVAVVNNVSPAQMPDILFPYKAIDLNNLEDYLAGLERRAQGGT